MKMMNVSIIISNLPRFFSPVINGWTSLSLLLIVWWSFDVSFAPSKAIFFKDSRRLVEQSQSGRAISSLMSISLLTSAAWAALQEPWWVTKLFIFCRYSNYEERELKAIITIRIFIKCNWWILILMAVRDWIKLSQVYIWTS